MSLWRSWSLQTEASAHAQPAAAPFVPAEGGDEALLLDSDSDDRDGDGLEPDRNVAVHRLSLAAWRVHCAHTTMRHIEAVVGHTVTALRLRRAGWHHIPFLVTAVARMASLAGIDPPRPPVSDADVVDHVVRATSPSCLQPPAPLPVDRAARAERALRAAVSALAERVALCTGLGNVPLRSLAALVAFLEWFCASSSHLSLCPSLSVQYRRRP